MPKIPTYTAQTRMTADVADIKTQYQAPLTGGPIAQLVPAMQKLNDYYVAQQDFCLLYTSPSPRDRTRSRMPSSA